MHWMSRVTEEELKLLLEGIKAVDWGKIPPHVCLIDFGALPREEMVEFLIGSRETFPYLVPVRYRPKSWQRMIVTNRGWDPHHSI